MASLGNTIINGILRVNGKINAGDSITAPSFIGDLAGNAASATKLETARTINGVAFDGTKNITVADSTKLPLAGGTMTGTIKSSVNTTTYLNGNNGSAVVNSIAAGSAYVTLLRKKSTNGVFTVNGYQGNFILGYTSDTTIEADNNTLDKALYFGESGTLYPSINNSQNLGDSSHKWKNVYATTFTGALSGNASTATKLATARTINGVSFDGTKNITVADSTKLPLAGGTVTGMTYFNQGTSVKTIDAGSGKTGYFKVCTFKITGNYQNQCIKLHTTQRNRFGNLYIIFSSVSSTNPSISAFYKDGSGIVARLVKSANGVFDLYIQKQESYDDLEVTLLEKGSYMSGTTITWVNATVSTLPNTTDFPTYKDATWLPVSGNAATATKLATARTISLTGDATASGSFNGTANLSLSTTVKQMDMVEDRDVKPSVTPKGKFSTYFATKAGLTGTADSDYQDLLVMNSWGDTGGGNVNALSFDKSTKAIFHYQAAQGATTWGTASQIAYTTSNVASATKLATARTIGVSGVTGTAQSFNGTKNIVIPITAVPASLITGTVASATKATQDGNGSTISSTYLKLSGGTMKGDIGISRNAASIDGSVPFCGGTTISNITDMKNYKTYLGTVQIGEAWRNIISVRHRNGYGDGKNFGMYLSSGLTSTGDLIWNKQYATSSWQGERTILDSSNYNRYAVAVHSGTAAPASSLGKNGDIYVLLDS